jgi:hypothetical protein
VVVVLNERPALLVLKARGFGRVVEWADRLRRVSERGVGLIDLDHGRRRREMPLEGKLVPQLLLEHVADHPLGLGAEHVERIGIHGGVRRALERSNPARRVALALLGAARPAP